MIYPAYGALGFSLSIVGIPLFMYLPVYYTSIIGINVGAVGSILLVARIIDMIFDPLIGYASDRLQERKRFMLFGSVLLLIGYYALIYPIASPEIWLLVTSIMVYLGWSLINVPYMAMSSEITSDYHEKTTLASYRESFALIGMMCALSIPYALNISHNIKATLEALFYVLFFSLPLTMGWLVSRIKHFKIYPNQSNFLAGLSAIFHSNTRMLIGGYFLNALANAIPSTLFLYYVSHILKAPEQSGLLLLLYCISGVLALPVWTWISKYTGKKKAWIASMTLASVAFLFVPLLNSQNFTGYMLIVIISGLSLGADLVLSSSLQSDAAQLYQKNGDNLSGVLFGLWAMGTKLALALGVGISFGTLGVVGFSPDAPTSKSLETLVYLYALAPVVLKSISILILIHYTETNEQKIGTKKMEPAVEL